MQPGFIWPIPADGEKETRYDWLELRLTVGSLGVQRCLVQLQLGRKHEQDGKQTDSSISWCVCGQSPSGTIKSHPYLPFKTVCCASGTLTIQWWREQIGTGCERGAGKPPENEAHLKLDQLRGQNMVWFTCVLSIASVEPSPSAEERTLNSCVAHHLEFFCFIADHRRLLTDKIKMIYLESRWHTKMPLIKWQNSTI